MHGYWLILLIYFIVLLLTCLHIIFDTNSSTKALAYLLFCVFIPVIGIIFYITFGVNYWRKKKYSKKSEQNEKILQQLTKKIVQYSHTIVTKKDISIKNDADLVTMVIKDLNSPLTSGNRVKILLNGEEKFPELLQCLAGAKHHIHLEYYIFEQGEIGTRIIEMLITKAKEGVQVRFIYDDFGSPGIKKKIENRMRNAGIEIYPFYKVHFYLLANRINFRNHRKIVVVDVQTGFVGGINVSDKYINNRKGQLYWRDTHLRIDGPGVYYLQYLFIADWNFCSSTKLIPESVHFGQDFPVTGNTYVQVVGSGPDSEQPFVMFSVLQAIYLAKEEILITTPYFIPDDNIIDALRIAASSGIDVKLLVPGNSDSWFVNAASRAYYNDVLQAGVEIYFYNKGFVHAKTLVTDGKLSMIGTANMDHRSFELNFEVNAIIYDTSFSKKMRNIFFDDLQHSKKLNTKEWYKRPVYTRLFERIARLFSPSL